MNTEFIYINIYFRNQFFKHLYRYVATKGLEPRILKSTAGELLDFVDSFDTPEKWKRGSNDFYNPLTPSERFDKNSIDDLHCAPIIILPTPLHVSGEFSKNIDFRPESWTIMYSADQPDLSPAAKYLNGKLT